MVLYNDLENGGGGEGINCDVYMRYHDLLVFKVIQCTFLNMRCSTKTSTE